VLTVLETVLRTSLSSITPAIAHFRREVLETVNFVANSDASSSTRRSSAGGGGRVPDREIAGADALLRGGIVRGVSRLHVYGLRISHAFWFMLNRWGPPRSRGSDSLRARYSPAPQAGRGRRVAALWRGEDRFGGSR